LPSCPSVKRVGFLINPTAGLGGAVGLKGTDNQAEEARARGARPVATPRAEAALHALEGYLKADCSIQALFLTASGEMGEDVLSAMGLAHRVVLRAATPTSAAHTRAACKRFLEDGADIILFCGGDGTARDVSSAVDGLVPVLGIPAGVKMHSGVFAVSPAAAADLAFSFLREEICLRDTEIADVDEELYRHGELQTRLYGVAKTPYAPALLQQRKQIYSSVDEDWAQQEIAAFAAEFMADGAAYIMGAGTTTARIAALMGLEKTLLGVDVVMNGKLILQDASEKDLLDLLDKLEPPLPKPGDEKGIARDESGGEPAPRIIVSPIGAQGFLLGRGSQQISPSVVRKVGPDGIIIVATPHKLRQLPYLLVDSGDQDLDAQLSGVRQVVVGYRLAQNKMVRSASDICNLDTGSG